MSLLLLLLFQVIYGHILQLNRLESLDSTDVFISQIMPQYCVPVFMPHCV